MDMTWVTDQIALGGGIWNAKNMAEVAHSGITHVIDMQIVALLYDWPPKS